MVRRDELNGWRTARRLGAATVFVAILLMAGPQLSPGLLGPRMTARRVSEPAPPGPPPAPARRPLAWRDAVRAGSGRLPIPRKTKHVNPLYPEAARQERTDGAVLLELLIDEGGLVEDARVIRSIGLLDDAALDAVRQWRFHPSLLDGRPVKVILAVKVDFAIQGPPV